MNDPTTEFKLFTKELDKTTDKREKLVKISREITLEAKRAIFALHRIVPDRIQINSGVFDEAWIKLSKCEQMLGRIASAEDLMEDRNDFYRFYRQISICLQEYVEALLFYYYLKEDRILPYREILCTFGYQAEPIELKKVCLPLEDYLLGLTDFTGELMRHSINLIPKGKWLQIQKIRDCLDDITTKFVSVEGLLMSNEFQKKIQVMKESLAKVEEALCNIAVMRGEYPPEAIQRILAE